jgi:hypothetical protein
LVLAYKVWATTIEPTTMARNAPAKRAAPAPVPSSKKERLRLLNSAAVNTSALLPQLDRFLKCLGLRDCAS